MENSSEYKSFLIKRVSFEMDFKQKEQMHSMKTIFH